MNWRNAHVLTTTVGLGEYASTEVSRFPVGQEWREQVPLTVELDAMYRSAYDEWHLRISSCMRDRGFEYLARPYADDLQTELHRMMNPLNADIGPRFGYHPPLFLSR